MSVRDYDKARMNRIGEALYGAILKECTDANRVCFIPVEEVFDAMALLGGVLLSTGPISRSPVKLREVTTDFGKKVALRARQAKDSGSAKLFDVVLDEKDAFH